MTSNEILKADVLDIVFDNRNKNYGAYLLRKYYNNRLLIALGGMLGFVVVLVIVVNLNPQVTQAIRDAMQTTETTVVVLPPTEPTPPPPPVEPPPAQRLRQVRSTSNIVIADVTDVRPQEDIRNAVVSSDNLDGIDDPGLPNTPEQVKAAATPVLESPPPPPPAPTTQASFPGGQEAWIKFLNRYLQTPSELQAGEKKSVLVRFAVDEEGVVSRFEIIQSGGASFDNEVIRVLKKMPKWKPAVQNGKNVSVMFTQPVTFVAFEE